jgi:hypothetical protein
MLLMAAGEVAAPVLLRQVPLGAQRHDATCNIELGLFETLHQR